MASSENWDGDRAHESLPPWTTMVENSCLVSYLNSVGNFWNFTVELLPKKIAEVQNNKLKVKGEFFISFQFSIPHVCDYKSSTHIYN